ncbi:MAG: hypothetical protein K2I90_03335, partial [Odoribacter sp.]|nr:hypothetical protein [Odoribacter sp.]
MKRLLTLLILSLGLIVGLQTAKAASYLDTIYLTYRLSADDTIRGVSVDINVNIDAGNTTIYFDWGESRSTLTVKNVKYAESRDFSGYHRWKNTNTGDVRVKIYGVSNIRTKLVSLKSNSSVRIENIRYDCAPIVQIDVRNCTVLTDL